MDFGSTRLRCLPTGELTDYVMSDEEIAESVKSMEGLPKPEA